MTVWSTDELKKVGSAEELQIAPLRPDGSLRNRVTIWVVRVDDGLYVRSYTGSGGAWYRAALASHKGRIRAGGVEKDVGLVEVSDPAVNKQVDAAYQRKYGRYPGYIETMLSPEVRATTLNLEPRETGV